MTYKRLAMELVRRAVRKWIEEVLTENAIDYKWVSTNDPTMQNDKKQSCFYWDCTAEIMLPNYETITVIAGGTADDLIGISESVLWNANKKILWMSVAETRKQLGITELNLKGEGI